MSDSKRRPDKSRPDPGPARTESAATPAASSARAERPPALQPPPVRGPEVLHAPWRDIYLEGLGEADRAAARAAQDRADRAAGAPPSGASPSDLAGSFLLDYWRRPDLDERNHVITRVGEGDTAGMILLNRYPYANGHLLIALGDPRPRLVDYTPAQRAALWRLVDLAVAIIHRALQPQGVNIGVNQGRAAGAGVPDHLHAHVVPRWNGDVNFFTVVGAVRVNPSALDTVAARCRVAHQDLLAEGWT